MSGPVTIDLGSTVFRSADLVQSQIDGEIVMMSVETGRYYSLDGVGTRVWELIDVPTTVSSICDRLVAEYQVIEGRCRAEVLALLRHMAKEGLVRVESLRLEEAEYERR